MVILKKDSLGGQSFPIATREASIYTIATVLSKVILNKIKKWVHYPLKQFVMNATIEGHLVSGAMSWGRFDTFSD